MDTFWKNYLKFVEDVRKIYVNFVIIVLTVSEKEIGGFAFIPPVAFHEK
jgi:hypothetical protein